MSDDAKDEPTVPLRTSGYNPDAVETATGLTDRQRIKRLRSDQDLLVNQDKYDAGIADALVAIAELLIEHAGVPAGAVLQKLTKIVSSWTGENEPRAAAAKAMIARIPLPKPDSSERLN
jgi:hypothetical protein